MIYLLCDSNVAYLMRLKRVTLTATATSTLERVSPQALSPAYELMIATPGDHQFEAACRFSQEQYGKHFSCELNQFYPSMFCLYKDGVLVACCGFRRASDERLFLEQYLDQPIEEVITLATGQRLERQDIVEIGGLAVLNRDEGLAFMVRLAPQFLALGFSHATCTVTVPVRKCLNKLGIASVYLAEAAPERVAQTGNAWGRYYALGPVVLAGAIQPAIDHMAPFLALTR
jgi:hypothetical protein